MHALVDTLSEAPATNHAGSSNIAHIDHAMLSLWTSQYSTQSLHLCTVGTVQHALSQTQRVLTTVRIIHREAVACNTH